MWLFVPSLSAPVSPASTSESPWPWEELSRSCTLSGKSPQPKSLQRAWKMGRWKLLQFGAISQPTLEAAYEEWLTSLPLDSRALITPVPESERGDSASTDKSGTMLPESLAKYDPESRSWKTSQQSLFPTEQKDLNGCYQQGSGMYLETFPDSGMTCGGELYALPTLGLRISAEGASSSQAWPTTHSEDSECAGNHRGSVDSLTGATKYWRTPNTRDHHAQGPRADAAQRQTTLVDQVMWQTPATDSFRSRGGDRKDEMGLDQQARLQWQTPNARDWKSEEGSEGNNYEKTPNLSRQVYRSSLPDHPTQQPGETCSDGGPGLRRRLNPAFAAMLMAWPWWWINPAPIPSARSAMASWRSRARRHLSNYLAGRGLIGGADDE